MDFPGAELLVIGGAVLALGMGLASAYLPWQKWAKRSLQDWAAERGYRITAIDDAPWLDRIFTINLPFEQTYRVSFIDERGQAWWCKAWVGSIPIGRRGWVRVYWVAKSTGR